jgi:hypothetical protein
MKTSKKQAAAGTDKRLLPDFKKFRDTSRRLTSNSL